MGGVKVKGARACVRPTLKGSGEGERERRSMGGRRDEGGGGHGWDLLSRGTACR